MAKKLTAKSIRQGQTVYVVSDLAGCKFLVCRNFVCDRLYIELTKLSVSICNHRIFYSRRKAISKAKELNRMMGVL